MSPEHSENYTKRVNLLESIRYHKKQVSELQKKAVVLQIKLEETEEAVFKGGIIDEIFSCDRYAESHLGTQLAQQMRYDELVQIAKKNGWLDLEKSK